MQADTANVIQRACHLILDVCVIVFKILFYSGGGGYELYLKHGILNIAGMWNVGLTESRVLKCGMSEYGISEFGFFLCISFITKTFHPTLFLNHYTTIH